MIELTLVARPLLLTLASASLSLTAVTNALAQTAAPAPPRMIVRYDDLNLSSDAGTALLLHRLERAARHVCGDTGERQPLAQLAEIWRCDAQSLEAAIAAVNAQKLTVAYQKR
jgi:UrcA family protein